MKDSDFIKIILLFILFLFQTFSYSAEDENILLQLQQNGAFFLSSSLQENKSFEIRCSFKNDDSMDIDLYVVYQGKNKFYWEFKNKNDVFLYNQSGKTILYDSQSKKHFSPEQKLFIDFSIITNFLKNDAKTVDFSFGLNLFEKESSFIKTSFQMDLTGFFEKLISSGISPKKEKDLLVYSFPDDKMICIIEEDLISKKIKLFQVNRNTSTDDSFKVQFIKINTTVNNNLFTDSYWTQLNRKLDVEKKSNVTINTILKSITGYLNLKIQEENLKDGKEDSTNKNTTDLIKEIEKEPKNIDLFIKIGEAFFENKKYSLGISYLKEALLLSPNKEQEEFIYRELGNIYIETQKNALALEYFQKSLKINPENQESLYYMASIYYFFDNKQSLEKSCEILKKLIQEKNISFQNKVMLNDLLIKAEEKLKNI
ncbi:MAG: hypothetical protein ACD_79C00239G0002 [uncultured bacterium]|nr:MAG: hypothetical protein ACD_79C00239G0002 [uncultured bacterium]